MDRRRAVIAALVLFSLNAWIAWRLFTSAYIDQMGSIEGTHIALGRWILENPRGLTWFPLWYGGIPWSNTYSPLHPALVAGVAALTGLSPAHSYHALTAVFYSLGPVTLFLLAWRLTGCLRSGFFGALFYSLISSSSFLIPAVRHEMEGVWHPRRLQALVHYGEGPHIAAMALVPLAILLLSTAFNKRRPVWWVLAALGLASVVLTNWIGAAALAFAVAALLLAWLGRGWWRTLCKAFALGVYAYCFAMPWIPLSAVFSMASQERYVSGSLPPLRWVFATGGAVAVLLLLWAFSRLKTPEHVRFVLLFLLPVAMVTLLSNWGGVDLVPQASRYHLEMEMGISLLAACCLKFLLDRVSRRTATVIAFALLVLSVFPVLRYRQYARELIRPIDISSTIEFRQAKWFAEHMSGKRIFASGSVGFFLNVFTDVPQYGGGFDQGVINPVYAAMHYQILSGQNAGPAEGDVAVLLLRAFGVDAAAVNGPESKEYYKPVRNPRKFEGLLPELWRDGDDVIFDVPRRSRSLAHVIRRTDLPSRQPGHGLDLDPVRPYVAALEDPALPVAAFQWRNRHEALIAARMEKDQILSVQISYHRGWSATANGQPCRTYGDHLGQLVVEPDCDGACEVILTFGGGLELLIARLLSLTALLGGSVWIAAGRRRSV